MPPSPRPGAVHRRQPRNLPETISVPLPVAPAVAVAAAGAFFVIVVVLMATGQTGWAVGLLVLVFLVVSGVRMAQRTVALDRHEVAVVTGRVLGPAKVYMGDRVSRFFVPVGGKITKLSLRAQPVDDLRVECPSADMVPLTIEAKGTFHILRDEDAVLRVIERFGDDEEQMRRQVAEMFSGHLRDVAGQVPAQQAAREAGPLAGEALRRAGPHLAGLGFEPVSLTVGNVVLPPGLAAEMEKLSAMGFHHQAVKTKIVIEAEQAEARRRNEAADRLAAEKAKADAHAYTERVRLEAARDRMMLADETRALEREHSRALAELEAYKLGERLRVETQYHDVTIQRMIVEQLPAILEAKGKLLPNLRTYIAGKHEDGLMGLMSGLAAFGPDIMDELKGFVASLSGGGQNQLDAPARSREIGPAATLPQQSKKSPETAGRIDPGSHHARPGHPPAGHSGYRSDEAAE